MLASMIIGSYRTEYSPLIFVVDSTTFGLTIIAGDANDNINIYWGDGSSTRNITAGDYYHDYTDMAAYHIINVTGSCGLVVLGDAGYASAVTEIIDWGSASMYTQSSNIRDRSTASNCLRLVRIPDGLPPVTHLD